MLRESGNRIRRPEFLVWVNYTLARLKSRSKQLYQSESQTRWTSRFSIALTKKKLALSTVIEEKRAMARCVRFVRLNKFDLWKFLRIRAMTCMLNYWNVCLISSCDANASTHSTIVITYTAAYEISLYKVVNIIKSNDNNCRNLH